ncbi:MAG: cell division protein FtsH [Epulopiscium sp. Nuni2H_MBin003]|nr:MAG: cell division protein FtsH [Epulopiscium sp. Nuni2H_MBin003]
MSKKAWILAMVICFGAVMGIILTDVDEVEQIPYTQFITLMENQSVADVTISQDAQIEFSLLEAEQRYTTENPRTDNFKEMLLLNGIAVNEKNTSAQVALIQYMFGTIIFVGVFFVVFRHAKNSRSTGFNVKAIEVNNLKMDFSDIAGNVEAKEQVEDIVDFIKNPYKYEEVGAKMPRGLIFYGPPGTGKTIMAKALAKEADVPFFSVNGSDFMQMYVGVGASRIRDLFKEARKSEKAVIFIDEIDAIGKMRSNNAAGSSDEKDQTLNALLTEMSGFNNTEGIVVIAATNRLELLDEALLRPGRFDRHIQIGYPDQAARKMILSLYIKNKLLDDTVDIDRLSEETIYFTGAMIENLVNEAAILAVKENVKILTANHFDKAFYTVIAGSEKKDRSKITIEDKKITAYHEAGHALVTTIVAPQNKVSKVTIIPSTKGAGGFSMNIAKEKMYQTKADILAQVKIALAGRVAEEIIFGSEYVTTGASNDIEKATTYIKDYITKYGMDDTVGMVNLDVFDEKTHTLDRTKELMKQLYDDTMKILEENKDNLDLLANELIHKETLNQQQIDELLRSA